MVNHATLHPGSLYLLILWELLTLRGEDLNLNHCSYRHRASEAMLIERENLLPVV